MSHQNEIYTKMLVINRNSRLSEFRTNDMIEFTFVNSGTNNVTINGILLASSGARGIQSNSVLVNFVPISENERDVTDYEFIFTGGLISEIYVFCKCIAPRRT
jgi:hypothetical protein